MAKKTEIKTESYKKCLEGTVVSAKSEKTVIVVVSSKMPHPKYHKIIKKAKRYPAHTEIELKEGDKVRIKEARPISKTKKWRVIEKLNK